MSAADKQEAAKSPSVVAWAASEPAQTKSRGRSLSRGAVVRASMSQTVQNLLRVQQFERENGHLDATLMQRVVLGRWKCLFLDDKTEELFGVYCYYDRIRRMNLSCLLFLIASIAYMFSVFSSLAGPSLYSRAIQLAVVFAISMWTFLEKRSLEALDVSPLGISQVLDPPIAVVSRATSPRAGRLIEGLTLFLYTWCAFTLILIRVFDGNWSQSPASLVFICWCGPVVLRLYFRHALAVNISVFFTYSGFDMSHNSKSIFVFHSMSLFSSVACGVILCYSSSMYRRMQLRSIIITEHVSESSVQLSPVYILNKERELRKSLQLQYKRMKFADEAIEKEYINFVTSRSRVFITVSLAFMVITNAIIYIPGVSFQEVSVYSKIRTYTGLPIWILSSVVILSKKTLHHRVPVTTVALILTLLGEFIALLPLSYTASDVYFLYVFRILDVTSTSFCLPLRAALLVYAFFGIGSFLMPFGGNVYFSYASNLIFVPAAIGTALYVSSVSHTDSRIAFLQKKASVDTQSSSIRSFRLDSIPEPITPKSTEFQVSFLQITEDDSEVPSPSARPAAYAETV